MLLLIALGVYLAIAAYLFVMQARLIYFPDRTLDASPQDIGLAYEPMHLRAADGVAISGWFVPHEGATAAVLLLHGNGGNMSNMLDHVAFYHELGYSTLLIDYRGYGESEGTPSERGLYADGEAAWRYLRETRGYAAHDVVLVGLSLGGGVASHLAAREAPGALILDSTFTSMVDLAWAHYPWLPVPLLLRHRYLTAERIGAVNAPLLLIHSRDDRLIPFSHAERLYSLARDPKTLVTISGDHVQGLADAGYKRAVRAFLCALPRACAAGASPHAPTK
jgi:hypothetical protein